MKKEFPKYQVIDEWSVAHDLMCVQLVEMKFNRRQRFTGGEHAVRIALADDDGDEKASLVMCLPAAMELAGGIADALKRQEALMEEK